MKISTKTRTLWLVALATMALTTSCLKDGWDDFDGLNKPIVVDGDFNPSLGVPIGRADMDVSTLIDMFFATSGNVRVDQESHLVTLQYDTVMDFHNRFSETDGAKAKSGSHPVMHDYYSGTIGIDLFDSTVLRGTRDITTRNIFVDLGARLGLDCPQDPRSLQIIRDSGLVLYVDSIFVTAYGRNEAVTIPLLPDRVITLDNFLNRDSVTLLEHRDIAFAFNVLPYRIDYSVRLNGYLATRDFPSTVEFYQYLEENLHLMGLTLNVGFSVDFPLSVSASSLSYDTILPLDLSPIDLSLPVGDISVDTATLVLDFDNGLPLELSLGAWLHDTLTGEEIMLVDTNHNTLAGSNVAYYGALNTYVTTSTTPSQLRVSLNQQTLDMLNRGAALRLHGALATSAYNNAHPVVSIRGNDKLAVRVYLLASPHCHISYPLTH